MLKEQALLSKKTWWTKQINRLLEKFGLYLGICSWVPHECKDCSEQEPPMFILRNEVWKHITTNKRDILCFDCAQKRLGRKIVWSDLKPCGITKEFELGVTIYNQSL